LSLETWLEAARLRLIFMEMLPDTLEKLSWGHIQRASKLAEIGKGWVPRAALNQAYVGPIKISQLSERLL